MRAPIRNLWLIVLLFIPAMVLAQNPAESEDERKKGEPAKGFEFKFKERPSFRFGEDFRLDLRTKWHLDFRRFDPPLANPPETTDTFKLQRARFGVRGKATKFFNYEVEREMRGTFGEDGDQPRHPWKDVYVEFRPLDLAHIRVGKFKVPFGMEQNTSVDSLDFAYRTHVSDFLAPARERGAMVRGKVFKAKRLEYEFGMFRYDGENSDIQGVPSAGLTYAGRISGEPLRYVKSLPRTIRHTYLGFAMTSGDLFEGQNAIHGQTLSNFTWFDHLFVKGKRQRVGGEVAWSEGPFSVKGEYIHMSEERKQQGIRLNDLPDKISRGWYVSGNWIAFGEKKSKGNAPKKAFLTGPGYGAIEFSARLDVLSFYSTTQPGVLASRSPRAANILPNSARTWTLGSTWYINPFMKLQANAEREWLADIERKGAAGNNVFWTGIVRLQFAM